MNLILDTHVVLWWQAGGQRLSRTALRSLDRADGILMRPRTCREIATLHRLGRVRLDRDPMTWVRDLLGNERVGDAPLSSEAATWAGGLDPTFPGDPIDRLLYATARDLRIPLVSKDERLREFAHATREVEVLW